MLTLYLAVLGFRATPEYRELLEVRSLLAVLVHPAILAFLGIPVARVDQPGLVIRLDLVDLKKMFQAIHVLRSDTSLESTWWAN